MGSDSYGSSGQTGGLGSDSYGSSGNQSHGSGTGGTTGGNTGKDSTVGKLMEKAGDMFKNEELENKGREKREGAGGLGGASNY